MPAVSAAVQASVGYTKGAKHNNVDKPLIPMYRQRNLCGICGVTPATLPVAPQT